MENSLDKVTIKGFKSIQSLEEFKLSNLNVLIGGNGAGKSNFIEFFRLLRATMEDNLSEYIRNSGGISDLLFNGRKFTKEINFEMFFGTRGYRFSLEPVVKENFALTGESRYYKGGEHKWWNLANSYDGTSSLVKEAKGRTSDAMYSKPVYDAIMSWQIYHFHDTSPMAGMRHAEIIQDNKKLRPDGTNIAPYILGLKKNNPDIYHEIVDTVRLVIPFF